MARHFSAGGIYDVWTSEKTVIRHDIKSQLASACQQGGCLCRQKALMKSFNIPLYTQTRGEVWRIVLSFKAKQGTYSVCIVFRASSSSCFLHLAKSTVRVWDKFPRKYFPHSVRIWVKNSILLSHLSVKWDAVSRRHVTVQKGGKVHSSKSTVCGVPTIVHGSGGLLQIHRSKWSVWALQVFVSNYSTVGSFVSPTCFEVLVKH